MLENMLQSDNNYRRLFEKSQIILLDTNKFIIDDEFVELDAEMIELLASNHPEYLKYPTTFANNPTKKFQFPLCAWLISKTDLTLPLATALLNRTNIDQGGLEATAFFFNYIKTYDAPLIKTLAPKIINFYNGASMNTGLKALFINSLSSFIVDLDEEWRGILETNWKQAQRDLSLSSLKALLKFNRGNPEFFSQHLEQFEAIDDLEVLADVVLASSNERIHKIFADRLGAASEGILAKRIKMAKVSRPLEFTNATVDSLFSNWSRVIQNLKSWPSTSSAPPSSMDLLSLLVISGLNSSSRSAFNNFSNAFQLASTKTSNSLLTEMIPEALNHCASWLHGCIARPLMQIFAQLIKLPSQWDEEVILNLCRLFMDGSLGTSVRRSFVNHLATHANDEVIGERCLNLIHIFVEKFPDSRYICLNLIKSLLDGVDSWDPRLLSPFYSAYSLMAWASDSVMNDLILLLKKQIYSPDPVYKRIGARGVGAFLATNGSARRMKAHEEALLPDPDEVFFSQFASCSQKPKESAGKAGSGPSIKSDYHLKIIISLLEESVKSLRTDRQAILIFLGELNGCFDDLDDEIKDWIGEWAKSVFQSSFIAQIEEDSSTASIYAYELDPDNPLCLNFNESELADCAPVLLSLLGRFEAYQNGGNLEGIDALQGCAIQIRNDHLSSNFHIKFIALNYFRSVLNVFGSDEGKKEGPDRFSSIMEIQKELKQIVKSKPPFLAEFKLFPESYALISTQIDKHRKNVRLFESLSVEDGSCLDEVLKEARKPEFKLARSGAIEAKSQLLSVTEASFNKALIPLNIELIEKLVQNPLLHDFAIQEIISHLSRDSHEQCRLLDCLLRIIEASEPPSKDVIEIVFKFKGTAVSSSQKASLTKVAKAILVNSEDSTLKESACRLLIDFLKSPEQISDPLALIKQSLQAPQASSAALKHLLSLKSVVITDLMDEMKNRNLPLKNRLTLLKGIANRFSGTIRESSTSTAQVQAILSHWADLVQCIRIEAAGSGERNQKQKLPFALVKESQSVLDAFLDCSVLKDIENDILLLKEGTSERESTLSLLKTVQQSTRGLQIICNHLKYSTYRSNSPSIDPSAIPNLKKSLESVIFRVKEILTKSGCLGAFWMGNLKHRDLDGQELSSQVELLNIKSNNDDNSSDSEDNNDIESESENVGVKALSEEYIYDSDNNDSEVDVSKDVDGSKDYLDF